MLGERAPLTGGCLGHGCLPARPGPARPYWADAAGLIGHVLAAAAPGAAPTAVATRGQVPGGHAYTRTRYHGPDGAALAERWMIHQGGHAWSGGVPHGSYTDPRGPNASAEFIRFFNQHADAQPAR